MASAELDLQNLRTAVNNVAVQHHVKKEGRVEWAHPILEKIYNFFNILVEYPTLEHLPPLFRDVAKAKKHKVTCSSTGVELTWGEKVDAEEKRDLPHIVISVFSGEKIITDNYMLRVSYEKKEKEEEGIYIYSSHYERNERKVPSNWITLSREQISSDEEHKLGLPILEKIASEIDTARRFVQTKHR